MDRKKLLLVAIVLIGIILIFLFLVSPFLIALFLAGKFGFIPSEGNSGPIQTLVVGEPSIEFLSLLDMSRDLTYVKIKDPEGLKSIAKEQLSEYNLVIIDQHLAAPDKKYVPMQFGSLISDYVRTGGNLVIVMDSAIWGEDTLRGGQGDLKGWSVTFRDEIIPVIWDGNVDKIVVNGKIYARDTYSQIMKDIEVFPRDPNSLPLDLEIFNVKPTGPQVVKPMGIQVAFIMAGQGDNYYPAIVETNLVVGKSIYFNYDPSITPGIWQNTLNYISTKK